MNSDKLSVLEDLLNHISNKINSIDVKDEKAFESKRKATIGLLNSIKELQDAIGWEITHERKDDE